VNSPLFVCSICIFLYDCNEFTVIMLCSSEGFLSVLLDFVVGHLRIDYITAMDEL
jgi:hypothetical protein